jgi:hypothetical protein
VNATLPGPWIYDLGVKDSWKGLSEEEQRQRLAEIISSKLAPPASKHMAALVASASRSSGHRRGGSFTQPISPPTTIAKELIKASQAPQASESE